MRIAIVHSFYRLDLPSGENNAVIRQAELLESAGHTVALIARYTDDARGNPLFPIAAGVRTIFGTGPTPLAELNAFRPDVVHIHNLHPNFGTRWLQSVDAPVVTTVHNYRAACANGLLFRDGATCVDCPSGHPWSAVQHKCYHGSALASLPLAMRNSRGIPRNELLNHSRRVIFLNRDAGRLFVQWGLDPHKVVVVPNSTPSLQDAGTRSPSDQWVVIGRLSAEKGVLELAREWPVGRRLDVVGDGEHYDQIRELDRYEIGMRGRYSPTQIQAELPTYRGIVVPSRCLEMQPTVAIEGLAAGVPIVAYAVNTAARIVEETGAGAVYGDELPLAVALDRIETGGQHLRQLAQRTHAEQFSDSAWLRNIEAVYDAVG